MVPENQPKLEKQTGLDLIRADEAAFFEVFSVVRSEELGMQDWDPELRAATLRFQFEARARGYRAEFPGADERLILHDGSPIGWLVVDRSGPVLHCIDIAVVPGERGKGFGSRVLRALQEEAASGEAVVLTVRTANSRAVSLYLRLGFRVIKQDDVHAVMEWRR